MEKTLGQLLREKLDCPENFMAEMPVERKHVIIKRKTNTMTKLLISVSSSKSLMVDFDERLADILVNAKIVNVESDWDGNIKTVEELKGNPTVRLVKRELVSPSKPSQDEMLNAIKNHREKVACELAAIDKEIEAVSNK